MNETMHPEEEKETVLPEEDNTETGEEETEEKVLSPKELRKKQKEEKRAKNPKLYAVLDWVVVIAVALAVALFINFFIIVNSTVPTGSMETTIMPGSRMIGFRIAYLFGEPQRGDIIIFKYPDDPSQLFVKRIVGMPGETVEIIDGVTYINGEEFEEDYINDSYWLSSVENEDYGPYVVPEDSYFMMGDNRGNSRDSRKWTNPYLEKSGIVGKAWLCYWPLSDFGVLK